MNTEIEWRKWLLVVVVVLGLGYLKMFQYHGYKDWRERLKDYLMVVLLVIVFVLIMVADRSRGS